MTPEAATALMNEALALQERGGHREALDLYARIVECYPGHPDAVHNLGVASLLTGRLAAAEGHLMRALQLRPGFARARCNLVRLWTRMDRARTLAEIGADQTWIAALDFETALALAEYFAKRKEHGSSLPAAGKAVALNPSSVRALQLLGNALVRLSRAEEGEGPLRAALALAPEEPQLMADLARCLYAMHARSKRGSCRSEGRMLIERALQRSPDSCRAHHEMGLVLEEDGEFADAEAAFAKALSIAPGYLPALSGLASVSRARAPQELLDRMEAALSQENGFSDPERCRAYQMLGKCYDARGDFSKAYPCFERANQLSAGGRVCDRLHRERYTQGLIDTYCDSAIGQDWPRPDGAERPVFIVGMPRSGTTLLEHMLASHPDVEPGGEVSYFCELERTQRCLHDRDGRRSERWPQRLRAEYRGALRAEFDRILDNVSPASRYVIDKMPFNFWQLGMILLVYPGARILHCRREKLDVALSCYFETFGDSHDWSWRLSDVAHYYRQYERLMAHWASLFGARIHEVRYENVVADPGAEIRAVLDFLGLQWSDALADYGGRSRSIRTPSNWQVRQPLYGTSVARWRHYEDRIGPLIAELG